MAPEPSSRSWVWHSTPESIEARKISILAIAEIVFALALYLGAARAFGWWLPVLTSAIAAPLVLLRSDASVERAVAMWKNCEKYTQQYNSRRAIIALLAILFVSAVLSIIYYIVMLQFAEQGESIRFVDVIVFGFIALNILIAVSEAIASKIIALNNFTKIVYISFAALIFGILLRSIFIRIISVTLEWRNGFAELPSNWQRVMLHEDIYHPPELLPGAGDRIGIYTLREIMRKPKRQVSLISLLNDIGGFALIAVWFTPAILWRFALKSTFWLYGPALLIAYPGTEGRAAWLSRPRTIWEWHQCLLGLVMLGVSVVTLTGFSAIFATWADASEAGVPFVLTWALALDWGALISQPWRLLSLLNLFCALAIFYWRDHLRARIRNDEVVPMQGWPVGWLMRLARLQIAIFIAYWLVSLWNLVWYLEATGELSLPW